MKADLDFLSFLDSMMIATEAPTDITGQTNREVRATTGSRVTGEGDTGPADDTDDQDNTDNGRSSDRGGRDRPEEDLGKTDDIFGTEEPEDQTGDTPAGNPEDDAGGGDAPTETQDNPEDTEGGEEDPNVSGDNAGGNEENPVETPNSEPEIDLAFADKNRVRDNLVQLYNIVSGDIELLTNSMNNIDTLETTQIVNSVMNHMRNIKDVLYKTLTQNVTKLSYDELLQKYITLKRVYDICNEMVQRYFKMHDKDKKNKNTT